MDDKDLYQNVGKRIKDLREKNSETQSVLASAINCNQNNIAKMEKGESLTLANLDKIAKHYNVSLDYLCKGLDTTNVLDVLEHFVGYDVAEIEGLDNTSNRHPVPHIRLSAYLYNYFKQKTLANRQSNIPDPIKKEWINFLVDDFNKSLNWGNSQNYVSFIALDEAILQDHPDIFNTIKPYIID